MVSDLYLKIFEKINNDLFNYNNWSVAKDFRKMTLETFIEFRYFYIKLNNRILLKKDWNLKLVDFINGSNVQIVEIFLLYRDQLYFKSQESLKLFSVKQKSEIIKYSSVDLISSSHFSLDNLIGKKLSDIHPSIILECKNCNEKTIHLSKEIINRLPQIFTVHLEFNKSIFMTNQLIPVLNNFKFDVFFFNYPRKWFKKKKS